MCAGRNLAVGNHLAYNGSAETRSPFHGAESRCFIVPVEDIYPDFNRLAAPDASTHRPYGHEVAVIGECEAGSGASVEDFARHDLDVTHLNRLQVQQPQLLDNLELLVVARVADCLVLVIL